MRPAALLAGLMLAFAGAGQAPAACSDEVAAFEATTNATGRTAIAANSGGQKDAAARGASAQAARAAGTPVEGQPHAGTGGGVDDSKAAAAAGNGGSDVMSAKVSLNDARTAANKGDEAGCSAALAKAKAEAKGAN